MRPRWIGLLVLLPVCLASYGCNSGRAATGPADGAAASGGNGGSTSDAGSSEKPGPGDGGAADRGSSTAASDALDPMSPTELCRASIKGQCERTAQCLGGTTLARELQLQSCMKYYYSCPDYYFGPDSNRTVADVAACLDTLAGRSCTDGQLGITPRCLLSGKRPDGAGCAYSSQCQGGTGWPQERTECGTCISQPGAGSNCPSSGLCRAGTFCSKGTQLCTPVDTVVYATEGQPCDLNGIPTTGCAGDLYCLLDPLSSKGICTARPSAGQTCVTSPLGGLCAAGSDCTSGVCAAPGTCGSGLTCDASSYCNASLGSCSPMAAVGEACGDLSSSSLPPCLAPATCNSTTGKCAAPRASGEACDADHPCSGYLLCVSGTCRPLDATTCPA